MLRFFTYWKLNSTWQFHIFSILYWLNIKYRIVKQIFRNDFLNHFVEGDWYFECIHYWKNPQKPSLATLL